MLKKLNLEDLTLMDALDLAIIVELEAKERYEEFVRQLGSVSSDDAGAFFAQMAINETKHADNLTQKRKQLFGESKSRMSIEILYEFQEIEAPEFDRAESFMSAKAALIVAKDSEQKAHDFFFKAEKIVKDPEVKKLFIELKEEELEHKNMIEEILNRVSNQTDFVVDTDDIDEPNGL